MGNILIEYDELNALGRISASNDVSQVAWNRISEHVVGIQQNAEIINRNIGVDWATVLSLAPYLAYVRKEFGFSISYNEDARILLIRYREEVNAVKAVLGSQKTEINEDQIQELLGKKMFTKRQLKPYQTHDVAVMVGLANGANFSVPGAGKTTVAFAVHLLTRHEDTKLLIVSPKNAFVAWDEVVQDCMDDSVADQWKFARLIGGTQAIKEILRESPMRMIITYEQLVNVEHLLLNFLATNKVHLILDESHKIKSGEQSKRGAALLRTSHLPVRKDILSGTPIPRSIEDICPQLDFLWPGQSLGNRIKNVSSPREILNGLYVRTTKGQLGLKRPTRKFIPVTMSAPQVALYGIIRAEIVKYRSGIRTLSNIDLISARRSVMRLLQISSNPILTVKKLTNEDPINFPYDDVKIEAIFKALVEEKDSPKIKETCQLARQIVAEGGKVVIWTTFVENVERIASLLSDIGSTYIHGGINTGDENDPNTREGRLKLFNKKDTTCNVLVANPAATAEGISLHHVCHNAIYVDRSFNAAHYLQSVDRIHRLGLDPDQETNIYVLESVAPASIGSIDFSVRRRLINKLNIMYEALEDCDLQQLALDEEEAETPLDLDITLDDLADVIDELTGHATSPGEEEVF